MNKRLRIFYIIVGFLSLFLGFLGIFLPILPTTPFLLLSAAIFARSSTKFYNMLINNRLFGRYIRNYREGRGVPLKVKILSIVFLWITIFISLFFFVKSSTLRIIIVAVMILVSCHIIHLKTYKPDL